MAEYLLKGAKMLAKTCPVCGSPMFSWKDRTFCAVCEQDTNEPSKKEKKGVKKADPGARTEAGKEPGACELEPALRNAIIDLTDRISREPDPARCRTLMEAVKTGVESLRLLD